MKRGTLLRGSLPLIIQFTVMVSQTHDTRTAACSWQVSQIQSKVIMLLLKYAFTVVQWLLQKCSVMFSLVHDAAEVAFNLHIKANRKNTCSTAQEQKCFENICVPVHIQLRNLGCSWTSTSISKLTCRTNGCHFPSMLEIHFSRFCSQDNSALPTPASCCPDTACTHAASFSQTIKGRASFLAATRGATCLRAWIISCLSAASLYYLKKGYFDSLSSFLSFLPPTSWWHFPQV